MKYKCSTFKFDITIEVIASSENSGFPKRSEILNLQSFRLGRCLIFLFCFHEITYTQVANDTPKALHFQNTIVWKRVEQAHFLKIEIAPLPMNKIVSYNLEV